MQRGVEWSIERQRDTMLHALRAFPPERALFGSDWPVCEGSAPAARFIEEAKRLVIGEIGIEAARALFCENAARVYRLSFDR